MYQGKDDPRACDRKNVYRTKQFAAAVARKARKRTGRNIVPYSCQHHHLGYYHIGERRERGN